ncbi:hypothetical protein QYE76_023326 [Lolium multiflorum]|uniref:Retrotransposon gag domain-containing protein n=1 Tax=Lolium multiflorum TaxID=4521 RepID=A0AAD8VSP1_LOLMU|nr:hypothetical protein QYE76_023326 [Lolium multiflorum]
MVDLSHCIGREPGFSFDINMAGLADRHGEDKPESSRSRGKDKKEADPRDRPQHDDIRYLTEEEVISVRYQRPLSAHLLNKYEQQYDRRRRYDVDDDRYRRSDADNRKYRRYEGYERHARGRSREQEDVDRHWNCPFFKHCWDSGMSRLPTIENCPECRQKRKGANEVSVFKRLGPLPPQNKRAESSQDEDFEESEEEDRYHRPRWCPDGLSHSQKRRVQRLRNLEEAESRYMYTLRKARPDLAVKIQQTLETEARPPKKVWRPKQTKADAGTSADTNMVFVLPSEFCAPKDEEVSVAQFDCGPRPVILEKPRERSYRHLKALYLKGYINGQPISKMLVDTGAAVNIMPYSMLRRLGRSTEDLIKTNVTLSDFNGQPSEAKGVLNVDLTVGRKTIPTSFFIVDSKSTYAVLLGRDWIHANCCIPSTMHQCIIQWDGDEVEVVHADDSVDISLAAMNIWEANDQEPLSGINLDDCERIEATKNGASVKENDLKTGNVTIGQGFNCSVIVKDGSYLRAIAALVIAVAAALGGLVVAAAAAARRTLVVLVLFISVVVVAVEIAEVARPRAERLAGGSSEEVSSSSSSSSFTSSEEVKSPQEKRSSSLSSSDSPSARKRRSLSPSVEDLSSSDQTEKSWLDSSPSAMARRMLAAWASCGSHSGVGSRRGEDWTERLDEEEEEEEEDMVAEEGFWSANAKAKTGTEKWLNKRGYSRDLMLKQFSRMWYRLGGTPLQPPGRVPEHLRDDVEGPGPAAALEASRLFVLLNHCSPVSFGRQHILARPVGHRTIFPATTSTSASQMAEEPVKYEDLPPEHKKRYDELKAILEADLIGAFEKTRSHGIKFKGFQPEGALDGLDLSLPSDERTRALRQEVNYAVAHSLHRHAESLVNTLERVALNVVQEVMKHKYSPSGPALGTHQGEVPLYTRPPLQHTFAAPQQQGSPAYVVYKVGGDPGDYQFLYDPPKEIPHGYVCTYVPDCNNWMTQVTAGRTATAGGVAGAGSSSGADAEKHAWLTKYATNTSHERSTSAAPTVDEITAIMRDQFGILPKKRMIGYSKPYPNDYDLIPLPPKYRLPDFTKFSGSEGTSSIEHVSRYLAQLGMVSASDELRVRFFSQSLTGPAFGWYTSLLPDSVRTWKQLEEQFHVQYHSETTEASLADLTQVRQRRGETVSEYIQRFRTVRNRCYSVRLSEKEAVELAVAGLSALGDVTFQASTIHWRTWFRS